MNCNSNPTNPEQKYVAIRSDRSQKLAGLHHTTLELRGGGDENHGDSRGESMSQIVKCGLIQCSNPLNDESVPVADIQKAMLEKHARTISHANSVPLTVRNCLLRSAFQWPNH